MFKRRNGFHSSPECDILGILYLVSSALPLTKEVEEYKTVSHHEHHHSSFQLCQERPPEEMCPCAYPEEIFRCLLFFPCLIALDYDNDEGKDDGRRSELQYSVDDK